MAKFKIGDEVEVIPRGEDGGEISSNLKDGDICIVDQHGSSCPYLRKKGDEIGSHGYCASENRLKLNKKETIMSNIKTFVKNLALSANEKLLREIGLKTEQGEYTQEAKDLVTDKLMAENEQYLIEIATKKKAEDSQKNK